MGRLGHHRILGWFFVAVFVLTMPSVAQAIPVQIPALAPGGGRIYTDDFEAVATARVVAHPEAENCGARVRPSLWSNTPARGGKIVRGAGAFRINACRGDLPDPFTGQIQFGFSMWGLPSGRYVLCVRATQRLATEALSTHRVCAAFRY